MTTFPEPTSTMTMTKKKILILEEEHVIEIMKQWAKTQGFSDRAKVEIHIDRCGEELQSIKIIEEYQTTS